MENRLIFLCLDSKEGVTYFVLYILSIREFNKRDEFNVILKGFIE